MHVFNFLTPIIVYFCCTNSNTNLIHLIDGFKPHRHFILFKPYGYISQFISNEPKSHKKKYLGDLFDFPTGTMAIGRLDEKSEGLLLLTTDGKISDIDHRFKS